MSASSPCPHLALQIGERQYALDPGRTYLLGRAAGCDLRLEHDSIAPHHARLRLRGEQVLVEEVGTGAVLRDGKRLGRGLVPAGAVLLLGQVPVLIAEDHGLAEIVPDALPAAPAPAAPTRESPAAAGERNRRRLSLAALPLRHSDEATFADLMADELRRAPWFTLSAALHALLLFLLYLWLQPPPAGGEPSLQIGLLGSAGLEPTESRAAGDLREPITVEQAEVDVPLVDEEFDPEKFREDVADPRDTAEFDGPQWLLGNPLVAPPPKRRGNEGEDILLAGGEGLDTGGFADKVTELREAGLEIVFVFDSTGSMARVIDATKRRLDRTLAVLQALVPGARVGVVTYRDRGDDEYVTRSIPLGRDFYRAANFVQCIEADGGGDPPEAVLEGLEEAFGQPWRKGARRVVVLVGDAPPHARGRDKLLGRVRRFQREGSSYVHTVVTGAARRDVRQAAEEAFEEIASQGHGTCLRFEDEEGLLQRLLTLAFGEPFESNLAQVDRLVAARREKVSTRALDLARRGGSELVAQFRREPVSAEIVQALIRRPRRQAALDLVRIVADGNFPETGRQAAAYALQRMLGLDRPPIDPDRGGAIAPQRAAILESMAVSRLDP